MRQKILDVKDASDVVLVVLIDGDSRIVVFNNALQHILVRAADVQVNEVLSRGHHFLGSLIAKTDNSLKHTLLVLYIAFIGQLQGLLKIVNRQLAVLLLNHFFGKGTALQQYCLYRPEKTTEEDYPLHALAAECQWICPAVDFRYDLAEKQQDKRQKNCNTEELQPLCLEIEQTVEDVVAQHDDGHIDEIVRNENRRQRAFAVFPELLDKPVRRVLVRIQCFCICRR